jgi:peptidyl-prolyl cis-trans isomerase A (cyclophilin A)
MEVTITMRARTTFKTAVVLAMAVVSMSACHAGAPQKTPAKGGAKEESLDSVKKRLAPGTYAVIDTSMGRIICELYLKVAPIGAANFIGLADGTKEWTDPKTNKKVKKPFYDGLIFHRVIPNFMVQGGDPLGVGMGGPGYQFKNEIDPKVKFDRAGRLAYANAGPNTNGSQFFITHQGTPWLDGGYTIFGQCIEGQEVVNKMATVKIGPNDKPATDIVMKKVTIIKGEKKKGK